MCPAVSWSLGPEDSRQLRALAYLSVSVLGGTALFGVGLFCFLVGSALYDGHRLALLAAIGLLAVAAFRLAILGPALREWQERWEFVRIRWLIVSPLLGGGVVLTSFYLGGAAGFLLHIGGIVVPMVALSAVTSDGHLDTETRTLIYRDQPIALDDLIRVRRMRLGDVTLYWLSYASGASDLTTPRLLALPTDADATVESALDRGVAADPGDHDPPATAVGYALAALGVFFLGFTAFLLTVGAEDSDGVVILSYVAIVFGGTGAFFLFAAAIQLR